MIVVMAMVITIAVIYNEGNYCNKITTEVVYNNCTTIGGTTIEVVCNDCDHRNEVNYGNHP